ncbi:MULTISPECIES: DUF4878 domain-containing protein [Mycolicibacterium]|uniref:Uncharacterized protein n=1 Tax=Mycolicibacterium phocaicum TaxID=319706 RepID=A0A7I7ZU00_9MYCO|nr:MULTISPECIES: DUF4878 domain-containing protein [Mycolicibacterium]MCX8554900.1 DUF4878 domain-containing protein [Mycolicibacterium mucogenicum]TLH62877.1 hypothetical protein C1S79_23315 [Mycolicibacterium phocaicum]BBZ57570.1 hypothetical protein MPHO_45620 [Mycolicibacterium phocaicum]
MTGWQGSGYNGPNYNGPNPGGGAGRSSDEEETAIHQTTPPAAPGWPPQTPPPLSQPPAGAPQTPAWGQPAAPQTGGWGQAPSGWGQPPAPPTAPGGYGAQPFVTPPKKNKVPLIIAAIVVVLVVLGGGIYYVYDSFGSGDSSGSSSASEVVKGYLEALSNGNADTALSFSNDQPASKEFLSSDVLKKQIAEWPISDIRILNEDKTMESIGRADVHVAAKFGDKNSDATIHVKKEGGKWQLAHAAVKLDLSSLSSSNNAADKTMTVFGKEVSEESAIYVFPGFLELGSTSPYVTVTNSKPLLLDAIEGYSASAYLQPKFALNDSGTKTIAKLLDAAYGSCSSSRSLVPPAPCPVKISDRELVDGTVTWSQPDMSAVKIGDLDEYRMEVRISGEVHYEVSGQGRRGGTTRGTVTSYVTGTTADVSGEQVKIKFN